MSLKPVSSWPVCLEHPSIRGIQVIHLTVLKITLYIVSKSLKWKKKTSSNNIPDNISKMSLQRMALSTQNNTKKMSEMK